MDEPTGEQPQGEELVAQDSPAEEASEEHEYSIYDAAAEAQAQIEAESDDAPDSETSGKRSGLDKLATEPEAPAPQENDQPKGRSTQSTLDRIRTLVDQGRESELTREEQGILKRLESRGREKAERERAEREAMEQEEAGFREIYLDLLALEQDDPAEFAKAIREEPSRAAFMRDYAKAHPEITLDNPDASPPQKSFEQMRAEAQDEVRGKLLDLGKYLGEEYGLSDEDVRRIAGSAKGEGTYLAGIIDAAVEKRATALADKKVKDAVKAREMELKAEYATKTIVSPRPLNAPNKAGVKSTSQGNSVADAYAEAKELLGLA